MIVKQGMTFHGWTSWAGVVPMLAGILLLIGALVDDPSWIPAGLLCGFFGAVVFMNIRGTLFDFPGKRCRVYQNFGLFKIGRWIPLSYFHKVSVTRYRENFSHAIGRSLGNNAHVRSYFISLQGDKVSLHVNELTDRIAAVEIARRIAAESGLRLDDRSAPPPPRPDRRR